MVTQLRSHGYNNNKVKHLAKPDLGLVLQGVLREIRASFERVWRWTRGFPEIADGNLEATEQEIRASEGSSSRGNFRSYAGRDGS